MLASAKKFLGTLPRPYKRGILVTFDTLALIFSAWAAFSLRFNSFYQPDSMTLVAILAAPLTAIPVFIRLGLYRSVIRYLPERAVWTIANAIVIATLVWVCVIFVFEISRLSTIPRSVPLIHTVVAFLIIGGSRFAVKYFLWVPERKRFPGQALIYGAGLAGSQLAEALQRDGSKYIAGFLDDDPALQGRDVSGVRVYHPGSLQHLIDTLGVREVILSMPAISVARRQQILTELSKHQVKIRTLPAITDLASGRYLVSQIREIDIDDILSRSSVPADPGLLSGVIDGRSILVSGAGGSIGSELCKLITKWNPRKLVLLESNEFALYQIERVLAASNSIPIIPVLGSVADTGLVRRALSTHAVEVVFHAAAHKHVPLVEANALEGVRNNVLGTQAIAEAAFELGVQNFVLISTDKAVRPTNVMGATKRWAELIVQSLARKAQELETGQKFSAVRFGNVLGSNGSVVPLFKEQIAAGGPVTVTDMEMTRYFMSIHEAAELIVQAGSLSEGGDIFILDMGQPVRVRDLAENMIRLAGFTVKDADNPSGDISISVIGRRPGEKTHEELFYDPTSAKQTSQPKILRSTHFDETNQDIEVLLTRLIDQLDAENEVGVRKLLFDVANRKPSEETGTVVSLKSKRIG